MADTTTSAPETQDETPLPSPSRLRLPLLPTPLDTLGMGWRRLRRMSTALVLLFVLALATLVATFVPQEPVIASTVRLWREGTGGPGAAVARLFDWLSLFDVFGSWWFAALTGLLLVSLTGCLVPRWRVFLRNVRQPAPPGTNLDALSHRITLLLPDGDEPATVLATARGAFRNYRTRFTEGRGGAPQLAVERGHWREFGSLVFHTSFYLLLIGVTLAAAFSFTGQVDFAIGDSFADTPIGYGTTTPGRFWGPEDHHGQVTTLDDFRVTYLPDGFTPDEFVSTVTISSADGRDSRTGEIRVNEPLHVGGLTYYQRGFGFAPEVRLRSGLDGSDLYSERLILRPEQGLWTGRGKVSVGNRDPDNPLPQIGIDVVFLPDADLTGDGSVRINSPEPRDPRMLLTLYLGDDLGLDQPLPLSRLSWDEGDAVDRAMLTPGNPVQLAGGLFEVEFTDLSMWSGLQVSHQPYRWLLLVAASLTLVGLIPSLYAYRRRLWLEIRSDHVVFAGVAQHRKAQFDREFERLADRLRTTLRS